MKPIECDCDSTDKTDIFDRFMIYMKDFKKDFLKDCQREESDNNEQVSDPNVEIQIQVHARTMLQSPDDCSTPRFSSQCFYSSLYSKIQFIKEERPDSMIKLVWWIWHTGGTKMLCMCLSNKPYW